MTRTNDQIVVSILRTVIQILEDNDTPLLAQALEAATVPTDSEMCECERWRDGATVCPVHPDSTRPAVVVRYDMPGPPPVGRAVRRISQPDIIHEPDDQHPEPWTTPAPPDTRVWIRMDYGDFMIRGGRNEHGQLVTSIPWVRLLEQHGPLELIPLTLQEQAEEVLYGPVGARWGNPDEPCPIPTCAFGLNHTGKHVDRLGYEVIVIPRDMPDGAYCTCGRPSAHHPTCDRYPNQTEENSDD